MTSPEKPAPARSAGPPPGILRRAYAFLTSPKLAIALLVGVLGCCVVGVTVFRGERAWQLIFATLWFNGLLALLAVSSAAAFFTRIWRRKLTLLSVGMILFHVSFLATLAGTVYDSLFFFRGVLRLTEGETLPNDQPDSYDVVERGRFFDFRRLRGETTLRKMHTGYKVDGQDKRAAYDVAVTDGERRAQDTIYITRHLDFDGVRYFPSKEGYSVLVVMLGKDGREIYGGHVPLQSLKQRNGSLFYTTGTASGPGALAFPAPPAEPRFEVQVSYDPSPAEERGGEVTFHVWPLESKGAPAGMKTGQVRVGGRWDTGDGTLEAREIRYWVGMSVRYDPGLDVIMTSLCSAFGGMVLTLIGRVRQGAARRRPTSGAVTSADQPRAARAGGT